MPRLHFRNLDNQQLISATRELIHSAETLEVKIIYHLDEIRCRGLESSLGHHSMLRFAVEALDMTPDQAAKRMAAVTNCRRCPELLLLLEQGLISLSTINMVGPKLTEANKAILLNEIIGKSTREIRQLLASVDAAGQRHATPSMIELKLTLTAEVLERWEHAKALACGAEMATLEDALTRIVDDYLIAP
mgnify:CR=1 FL=1